MNNSGCDRDDILFDYAFYDVLLAVFNVRIVESRRDGIRIRKVTKRAEGEMSI